MNRGFALIELLLVLAILGLLGGVGMAGLQRYLETQRLNQALEEVAGALRGVAGRALQESRPYQIQVRILESGWGSRLEWSSGREVVGQLTVPNGVRIVQIEGGYPIEFVGRGFPRTTYRLHLQIGSRPARRVVLLPTGKVVIP